MGRLWGYVGLALVVAVFFIGMWLVMREPKKKEHSLMTDADVALYRRAARLLSRMVNATNLDDLTGDLLSPGTLKDVEAWLNDYKKELNQNAH